MAGVNMAVRIIVWHVWDSACCVMGLRAWLGCTGWSAVGQGAYDRLNHNRTIRQTGNLKQNILDRKSNLLRTNCLRQLKISCSLKIRK